MNNNMEMPSSMKKVESTTESEAEIDDDMLFAELLSKKGDTKLSKEIAEKLNVTPSVVSAWENGRAFPEVGRRLAVAKLYGIEWEEFIRVLEFSRKARQMKMDTLKEAQRDEKPKPDKI